MSEQNLDAKKPACAGCRNNYYNHGGNATPPYCWSLPDAKIVVRWAINMQSPMDERSRFRRVKVYNCYHGEGPYRDVYMERLPQHLGGDFADAKERAKQHYDEEIARIDARAES